MVNRAAVIVSSALIAAMVITSALAWSLVPSSHIAVHFDIDGHPNGYAPRWLALAVMPITAALLTVIMCCLPYMPGKTGNAALATTKAYIVGWVGTIVVLCLGHALIILRARGILLDVVGNITFIAAVLFIALGNFLGKIQPNDYAGVRTPWTRSSDLSWEKTNRLGGWILVAVGLATVLTMALVNVKEGSRVLVGGLICSLFLLVPASWYYWKQDPDRE